jgi:type II secretory pathway component PulK
MKHSQSGTALVVGLLLLSLVTLLGLAGAAAAQVELQLARNEQFRENASSAASAGIEIAIRHVTASLPESVPSSLRGSLSAASRYEVQLRFLGYEARLPQSPGANLAGAHFEILSTGRATRGAADRQRAVVMRVVELAESAGADCEPAVTGVRCARMGQLRRLSWQRLPLD